MRLLKPFVSMMRKSVRVHTNEQFSVDNRVKENGANKMLDENRMIKNELFFLDVGEVNFFIKYETLSFKKDDKC